MTTKVKAEVPRQNSQTMEALVAGNYTLQDELVVDHDALAVPTEDVSQKHSQLISTYVVREGDTLSQIAEMFQVSVNTVMWSNNLTTKDRIKPGQTLVILPVSGVSHIVKKGDTIQTIAKKYKADEAEIRSFNALADNATLAVGDTVIIPDGELVLSAPVKTTSTVKSGGANGVLISASAGKDSTGYFINPVSGARRTQGIHGYNGVDLASKMGAPIVAAAGGTVVISRSAGWNGGYGSYVVISHPNGMQTLYAHLSEVSVGVGETVVQGQQVGKMGASGKATGIHLHFEVRGGKNPF